MTEADQLPSDPDEGAAEEGADSPRGPGWWQASDGLWYGSPAPRESRFKRSTEPYSARQRVAIGVGLFGVIAIWIIAVIAGFFLLALSGFSQGEPGSSMSTSGVITPIVITAVVLSVAVVAFARWLYRRK